MRRVLVCLCAVVSFVLADVVSVHASEPVTLAWDANTEPDLAGYIVEYGTSPGQYFQSIQIGKTTQLTVTGLQPSTTYYFVVRAYNSMGAASAPSNQIEYRTQGLVSAGTLSRPGPTVVGFTPGTTVRGTDTGYDPARDVFLMVFGEGPVYGAFADGTGTAITPAFTIVSSATPAYFPRAEYSPHVANGATGLGGFLVTWHQTVGAQKHVFARVVSYVGPSWSLSTPRQISDNTQGSAQDPGPAVAYSPTSRRFLVAWKTPQAGLRGRFVDTAGNPIGSSMEFETAGGGYPSLAWNAATDEFGLAAAGGDGTSEFTTFRRIRASSGATSTRDTFGFSPKIWATAVDVNSITNDFVVVWGLGPGMMSATFDQFGSRLASNYITDRLGFDNSLGLAFNEATGTFLAVGADRDSLNVAGVELRGNGASNSRVDVITQGATVGSYHPRTAARTGSNRWLATYSLDLRSNAAQAVVSSSLGGGSNTPAPPPPSGIACVGGDPFAAMGGGTCCNGGWLPPGMACTIVSGATPPQPQPTPTPPPTGGIGTGAACSGGDPFVAMGGGTCCNGGWLPPGMTCSFVGGTTPPTSTTPPPTTLPPTTPPPNTNPAACATPDPFVILGGGTCCNGGWLPPGMVCASAPPASTIPPQPPFGSSSACVGSDPFVILGGGTCCRGGWLPPGMACKAN